MIAASKVPMSVRHPQATTLLVNLEKGRRSPKLVFGMRANARTARRAGQIVRLPKFRSSWADEGGPSTGIESIGRTPT
jgi:hypothetical protein